MKLYSLGKKSPLGDKSTLEGTFWQLSLKITYGSLNGPDAYEMAVERVKSYNEKY